MKRNLIAMVWLAVGIVIAWSPGVFSDSFTIERLTKLASTDLLPEVRAAAALGLANLWATSDIATEELKTIAEAGITEELREAAQKAIAVRIVNDTLSLEQLQSLTTDSPYEAVRQRASQLLSTRFVEAVLPLETLEPIARTGETVELRQAVVAVLSQAWMSSTLSDEALIRTANEGETPEIRQAASMAVLARLKTDLAELDTDKIAELVLGKTLVFTRQINLQNAQLRQAAAQPLFLHFDDDAVPLEDVETIAANPDNSLELRQVAGLALSQRLLTARRPLEALQTLAAEGATLQVQQATVNALVQALVTTVGMGQITVQELADSVSETDSDALNQARANAVFTLLRPNLIFLTDQPFIEAVMRGETVEIGGVSVDGGNVFMRDAATDFLGGLFLQFGAVNRFDDPLNELLAMAADENLESGFRQAAGQALVKFLSSQRDKGLSIVGQIKRDLDRIVIQGRRGQTEEALAMFDQVRQTIDDNTILINTTAEAAGDLGVPQRLRTIKDVLAEFPEAIRTQNTQDLRDINTTVSGEFSKIEVTLSAAPNTTDETLIMLVTEGATAEVRQAAATVLAGRLESTFGSGEITLEALLDFAVDGATVELQTAAITALTQALLASERSDDDLFQSALEGQTDALRLAAARAWIKRQDQDFNRLTDLANGQILGSEEEAIQAQSEALIAAFAQLLQDRWKRDGVDTVFLLNQAANGETEAFQQAAGNLLRQRFIDEGIPEEELFDQAINAESQFVRQAAADALTEVLISQRLSETRLFALASEFTLLGQNFLSSPELVQAVIAALAERFLNPLLPAPPPEQPKQLGV